MKNNWIPCLIVAALPIVMLTWAGPTTASPAPLAKGDWGGCPGPGRRWNRPRRRRPPLHLRVQQLRHGRGLLPQRRWL